MRGWLLQSIVGAVVLSATLAGAVAAQEVKGCRDAGATPQNSYYGPYWNGMLPVEILRERLKLTWPQKAVETADPFPAREMIAAISALGDRMPPDVPSVQFENYLPPGIDESPDYPAYSVAAALYRQRDFALAIPELDLVSLKKSPYRAAAAYTAARAALLLGRYEDGIKRLDRLIDDPSMSEFHAAALNLVGTLHYQYGSPPLLAAHFAQIAYLLSAPPELVCRYPTLRPVIHQAQEDLTWYLGQKSNDPRNASETPAISRVMDALSASSPLIDLSRVLNAPTPFARDSGWLDNLSFVGLPGSNLHAKSLRPPGNKTFDVSPVEAHAKELTAYAKKRWLETKNVLWAYALARRSQDVADVEILNEAIAALGETPVTPAAKSSNLLLRRSLTAQGTRLLLMAGRTGDALEFLHRQIAVTKRVRDIEIRDWYGSNRSGEWPASFVLNGGIRWFLQRKDFAGARKWSHDAAEILNEDTPYYMNVQPNVQLAVLLAVDVKEIAAAASQEGKIFYGGVDALLAVADMFPAKMLIELSEQPKMERNLRRALFAAGWTRAYLLGRTDETMALLPRLRELFPELKGDVNDITGATFAFLRDRAITRMLLRAPAFQPRPRWMRRGRDGSDIFSIYGGNPSDGNWWCPLDTSLLKADMALDYFARPLNVVPLEIGWFGSYFATPPEGRARLIALADDLMSWHPLFKKVDKNELEALARIDSGPKMLTQQTVAWADWSNWFTWGLGFDNALPETLHLAVRSTRYGCRRNGPHGEYSKAAFRHLHRDYPSSEWTKKTPYWFN